MKMEADSKRMRHSVSLSSDALSGARRVKRRLWRRKENHLKTRGNDDDDAGGAGAGRAHLTYGSSSSSMRQARRAEMAARGAARIASLAWCCSECKRGKRAGRRHTQKARSHTHDRYMICRRAHCASSYFMRHHVGCCCFGSGPLAETLSHSPWRCF